jgi:uncharacterized membrane protein HdeD (DUF308 family)
MEPKLVSIPTWERVLLVIVGILAIVASIYVLVAPGIGLLTAVFLLSFSLLFVGVARVARGISLKALGRGYRALNVIVGLLGIAIGIVVLLFPLLGVGTLIFLLAFAAMLYGIASLVIGVSDVPFTRGVRALVLISAFLSIILSIIVLASPAAAALTLVFLLSISFMVTGIESIVIAFE